MKRQITILFVAAGGVLLPLPVFAQSITSVPAASVPALPPWGLWTLGLLLLIGGAVWLLRKGPGRRATAALLALAAAMMLSRVPTLWATLTTDFTNPAGQTLSIPVTQILSGSNLAGWQEADFTNTSGSALKVSNITLPTYSECLPGGLSGSLLAAGTPPTSPPTCTVGLTLADSDTCRVDVDTACRSAVSGLLATLTSIASTSGAAAGGTGLTLTGTNLTGATGVTFGGVAATSVNVVNATTVTLVSPAHATGAVDVVISTPQGSATLSSGYTYLTTAIGQSASGGIIADLGGGLDNLIAATSDISSAIQWGGFGTAIGVGAQSTTDGATNTSAIVSRLGSGTYAADVCHNYEVDSQGNTPCQTGNTCYNDWFLPANDQLNALYTNRTAIGGFTTNLYWSSTEYSSNPSSDAYFQDFSSGTAGVAVKITLYPVRCVRVFTP